MSRLSKNILYNILGQSLLVVLGFVAVKYVFKQLGPDSLGILYFAAMLNAVLYPILDIGMGSTTVREISAHEHSEPAYLDDLLQTFSSIYWASYLFLVLAVYRAAPWLMTEWINLKSLDPGTATRALRILAVGALLVLPRAFYRAVVGGLQRMELNNLIDVGTNALQQIGTILILLRGGSLIAVVYWLSACFAFGTLAYIFACARIFSFRALLPGFSSYVIKRNLRFGSRAASISILGMIHGQADKMMVSKLLPLGIFGYYSFASGAISRGALVTNAVSGAALPSFSSLFGARDRANLMAQYRKLQDLLCFGIVPLFAAIPFAATPLFTHLLNAQAARMLLLPATLLGFGFYMNATLNVPYVFSLAVGKPEIAARSNLNALFVVLPATLALVYFFRLEGAGLSWVFYNLFAYSYAVPRICAECLEMPVWRWYAHVFKVVALAASTYGGAWMILPPGGRNAIAPLLLAYGGASSVFLIGAYLIIGHELRQAVLGFNKALIMRIAQVCERMA